mgnify:CR=1 FL=1
MATFVAVSAIAQTAGTVKGIVTRRDILEKAVLTKRDLDLAKISDIMTAPVITILFAMLRAILSIKIDKIFIININW